MKTLKNHFLSFMLILFSAFSYAQEASTTFISSSLNIYAVNKLFVNFDGEVNATTWNKDYVLIEMEIKANGVSLGVAKYLVSEKRFCLETKQLNDGSLVLLMPNCKHKVLVNGQRLSEDISYRVYVPKGVTVRMKPADQLLPCPPEKKPMAKLLDKTEMTNSTTKKEQSNSSL